MARKLKPKPHDPAQFKRFLEMAELVEAEDDPRAVDRAFKKVTKTQVRRIKSPT